MADYIELLQNGDAPNGDVAFVCGPNHPSKKYMVIGYWFMVFPKDWLIELDPMTKIWRKGHRVYFDIHKELSNSYREGIDPKLKTMAFPYKMKGWTKLFEILTFGFFDFIRTCQNLIGRA